MFWIGTTELILIGIIVLLVFGSKRLPEIGKGLGETVKEIRKIKKRSTPDGKSQSSDNKDSNSNTSMEKKIAMKAVEKLPGVKKVMDVGEKMEKLKKIIDE